MVALEIGAKVNKAEMKWCCKPAERALACRMDAGEVGAAPGRALDVRGGWMLRWEREGCFGWK